MNKGEIINEIIDEVKKEMDSDNLYKNLGTIVDQGMARQERKDIQADFNTLNNLIKEKLNLNLDDDITCDQIANLYQQTKEEFKWQEFDFDEDYQNNIFSILNHPDERQMSVKDFIKEYIILKNKIQIKEGCLAQLYDNLQENKETYDKQILRHQEEKNKGNKQKINLGITVFEASNFGFNEDNASYIVKLICEKTEQTTNISKMNINDGTIIWNENFRFELKERNQKLYIIVIRNQITSTNFGSLEINLEQIDNDQQRIEKVFSLLNSSQIEVGKIRLKLHYVYDTIVYFSYLKRKVTEKINNIQNDLNNLNKFKPYYNKPFGIIMSGGIYYLTEEEDGKNIFDKYKDTENLRETIRKSVYKTHNERMTDQLYINSNTNTVNMDINPFSKFKTSSADVNINPKTEVKKYLLYLIILGIFLAFFNCSDRNDLLNFLVFCVYLILYLANGKYDSKYLNYMFYVLIYTEILDIIWLLSNVSTYLGHYGFDSILRSIIYFSSFINFLNKGVIAFTNRT